MVNSVSQLVVLAVLSRLLTPADFGLVALSMIVVNFAVLFADGGMVGALVQRGDLKVEHTRVAFTMSLVVGLLFAVGIFMIAPAASAFFDAPALSSILRTLCLAFLLISLGLVSSALLWRDLRLQQTAAADIAGYVGGYGVVGITLALAGFGVWALVWAVIVQYALRTAIYYAFSRHPVTPLLRKRELADLLGFGVGLSLTKISNLASSKADFIVVGKMLGTTALGLYERAFRLMEIPANHVAGVVNRVGFPVMSRVQAEPERLSRIYLQGLQLTGLVYLPMAALLYLCAGELIRVLFGAQWGGAVAPLKILALGLFFRASVKVTDSLTRAVGAVYRSAWRNFVYLGAVIVGAVIGSHWGLVGVAMGGVSALLLRFLISFQLAVSVLGIGWRPVLATALPGVVVTTVTASGVVLVQTGTNALGLAPGFVLVSSALAGGTILCASPFVMPPKWLGARFFFLMVTIQRALPFRLRAVGVVAKRGHELQVQELERRQEV